MKSLSLLLLLFIASPAAFGASPSGKALPYARCIQTDKINEWHVVDARTALVRTGPYRYVVHLKADCPRLGIGVPGFMFQASEAGKSVGGGRICGQVGETVSARDQPACAISSVETIDTAAFEQMRQHAARHGSGAELPPDR